MRKLVSVCVALALALTAVPLAAQDNEEARSRDLRRLQEDLANLDEELRALEPGDKKAEDFRQRAEEIREETIYLKVKMRHHQRSGREGTGVDYEEVAQLRRSISDLREDMERAFSRSAGEVRLREGTDVVLRLDESLSSKTARREDRFEASVHRPVRSGSAMALAAGTRVRGIVREAEPAQRGSKGGRLELDFDAVYLDRSRLDLRSRVVAVHADEEDRLDTKEKAGLGAVLGGMIGGILGGKKGAIAGVIIGGTGAVAATKGDDVDLPAGTLVTIRLEKDLTIPRR